MGKIYGGRWETINDIPEGGQAFVYIVRDTSGKIQENCVLKRLKNKKRLDRFQREVEVLKKIDHPNILRIYDYDTDPVSDYNYYVSEYCRGGALTKPVKEFWKNDLSQKFRLCKEICAGLAIAHNLNPAVYHRDLKPDNIYLRSEYGPAVIGDFGICYTQDGDRFTLTEEAVGSKHYMHPELEDGIIESIKPYHDFYSLGKVIYWIFSEGKIFAREKLREEGIDLSVFGTYTNHYEVRPEYEHIMRLLDKMITSDQLKYFNKATTIFDRLELIERLMTLEYNPIGNNNDQWCRYCGLGKYSLMSTDTFKMLTGGTQTGYNNEEWKLLKCEHCGNIQIFQIAYGQAKENWDNPKF